MVMFLLGVPFVEVDLVCFIFVIFMFFVIRRVVM